MRLRKNKKFWAEIQIESNGSIRILKASKLTGVNQHARKWNPIDVNEFSEAISGRDLVLK